jgi:hypothetical protein
MVNSMDDPDLRRHIAEVSREHDQMMVKHANGHGNGYAVPRDAGLLYRDNDNALAIASAPEPEAFDEGPCFTEAQFDTLAFVLNELRKQWQDDIERAEQRILQAVVRCCLPGELTEREVHDLRARVIRAEQHIERQLKAAIGDDNVVDLPAGFIRRRGHAA